MGKVYDALRRAEEQRSHRIQETADAAVTAPVAPASAGPMASSAAGIPAPTVAPKRVRRRSSLLAALRAGSETKAESASDLNKRRITLLQPESVVAEQFRSLRGRIDAMADRRPIRSIAVTSARQGDGKSLGAISLAAVTAMQPGRRVLLIDCDLRDPAVASSLGLRVDAGVAEVLSGSASLAQAICKADGVDMDVLAVRAMPTNPSELLASGAMAELVAKVSEEYDRVVLDLPPILGLPDAKTAADLCDGVVFMVRADHTPAADVDAAIDILGRESIIGLVMNGASVENAPYLRG